MLVDGGGVLVHGGGVLVHGGGVLVDGGGRDREEEWREGGHGERGRE